MTLDGVLLVVEPISFLDFEGVWGPVVEELSVRPRRALRRLNDAEAVSALAYPLFSATFAQSTFKLSASNQGLDTSPAMGRAEHRKPHLQLSLGRRDHME